jgi:hypothetical protein
MEKLSLQNQFSVLLGTKRFVYKGTTEPIYHRKQLLSIVEISNGVEKILPFGYKTEDGKVIVHFNDERYQLVEGSLSEKGFSLELEPGFPVEFEFID